MSSPFITTDSFPSSSSSSSFSSFQQPPTPRKRTSSFSFPSSSCPASRPLKAPRTSMGSLRRTSSYLTLEGFQNDFKTDASTTTTSSSPPSDSSPIVPYHRTLRYYKEQRERRKALLTRHTEPAGLTIHTQTVHTLSSESDSPIRVQLPKVPSVPSITASQEPSQSQPPSPSSSSPAPPPPLPPLPQPYPHIRTTSPLAPVRMALPPRTTFPRSKPEPDLYRKAITTRMRCSPEGQKILVMGARLAVSILTATRELERIVAQQGMNGMDVDKEDVATECTTNASGAGNSSAPLTNSWVIVPGEDWEMVDCSA